MVNGERGDMMGKKVTEKKKKILEIVQQLEWLGIDIPAFIKIIESIEQIQDYALIVHDKDKDENGEYVKPHVHCVIRLNNAYAPSTLSNWILTKGANVNVHNIEYAKGKFMHMLAYLTHSNAPEKYQYADEEVISNFDWKKEVAKLPYTDMDNLLNMIETGEIREYNKTKYIPMHTMVEHQLKIERAFKWRAQRRIEEIREGVGDGQMGIDVIYIEGESGAGKTTYAKMLCDERNYSYCISSSANDPLQDYMGQDALILDDLRGTTLTASDLLKLLDNHTRSSVKSRYNNKWLYECKLIIITSVFSLEQFFKSMKESEQEPIEQFKRRCETRIKMTKARIMIYAYNVVTKNYEPVAEAKNSIINLYEQEQAKRKEKAKSFLLESLQQKNVAN